MEKSTPDNLTTSTISKKLPIENNRPFGENSPNLVTLLLANPQTPAFEIRKDKRNRRARKQGCQMAYFQTKNINLGKFWRVLQCKILVYLMAIWPILWPFGIGCGHLVHFMVFGIFSPVLVFCTSKNLATLREK
jgi:hypothetical protein